MGRIQTPDGGRCGGGGGFAGGQGVHTPPGVSGSGRGSGGRGLGWYLLLADFFILFILLTLTLIHFRAMVKHKLRAKLFQSFFEGLFRVSFPCRHHGFMLAGIMGCTTWINVCRERNQTICEFHRSL